MRGIPTRPAAAPSEDVEARAFAASEIRDRLADMSDLDYGTRNRVAWALVDWLTAHDAQVRADVRRTVLGDLRERTGKAAHTLDESVSAHWEAAERIRLRGKAEGIRLALSYVNEALRMAEGGDGRGH